MHKLCTLKYNYIEIEVRLKEYGQTCVSNSECNAYNNLICIPFGVSVNSCGYFFLTTISGIPQIGQLKFTI